MPGFGGRMYLIAIAGIIQMIGGGEIATKISFFWQDDSLIPGLFRIGFIENECFANQLHEDASSLVCYFQ